MPAPPDLMRGVMWARPSPRIAGRSTEARRGEGVWKPPITKPNRECGDAPLEVSRRYVCTHCVLLCRMAGEAWKNRRKSLSLYISLSLANVS